MARPTQSVVKDWYGELRSGDAWKAKKEDISFQHITEVEQAVRVQ